MEDHFTPSQVAERLKKSRQTLARWRKIGRGPTWRRVGRNVRYPASAVDQWLKDREWRPLA